MVVVVIFEIETYNFVTLANISIDYTTLKDRPNPYVQPDIILHANTPQPHKQYPISPITQPSWWRHYFDGGVT